MSTPAPAYQGALPRPTPETQPFWDGARAHRLMLPWCEDCGEPHFYPRSLCPHCLSDRLDWREATGRGRIHTYIINHKAARGFERLPYVIAVIDLAEGPRMLSNVVVEGEPTPETVRIDMEVEVFFDDVTPDISLPRFRPAGDRR